MNHLDTKNLVPFSKRRNGFRLPGMKKERDEEMLEQVDPDLQPEDEGVIRRYLRYADTLLGTPEEPGLTLIQGGAAASTVNAAITREFPVRFTVTAPPSDTDDRAA